jgi:hypothetical protein
MAKLILFNEISIPKKVGATLKESRYEGFARNAANTRFVFAKQQMMKDFDAHPVTEAMVAGPYATESTDGLLPYGNLPAFLGNEDSQGDVAELRNVFERINFPSSRPVVTQSNKDISYVFKVAVPEVEDIYKETEDSSFWSSKSWVSLVENGLSNFGAFIFSLLGYEASVSGTGLQRGKARRTQKNSPKIPYVAEILKNFAARFKT